MDSSVCRRSRQALPQPRRDLSGHLLTLDEVVSVPLAGRDLFVAVRDANHLDQRSMHHDPAEVARMETTSSATWSRASGLTTP